MKKLMTEWRIYEQKVLLEEMENEIAEAALILEQKINEEKATWGDIGKFFAVSDPKTWKNRLKGGAKFLGKAAVTLGITAGAAAAAPKFVVAMGLGKAGPKIIDGLISLLGDDPSTWAEDKVKDAMAKLGVLGNMVGAKFIMGAIDKVTKNTPLDRLNITDNITKVIDKKITEEFYTYMNNWFKENPNGPTGNPDEVIPKRWADKMFNQWLNQTKGANVGVKIGTGEAAPTA